MCIIWKLYNYAISPAVVDLNGRFFGGRTVAGGFFDHKRFANYDLAP